eukprot:Opistho-2@53319
MSPLATGRTSLAALCALTRSLRTSASSATAKSAANTASPQDPKSPMSASAMTGITKSDPNVYRCASVVLCSLSVTWFMSQCRIEACSASHFVSSQSTSISCTCLCNINGQSAQDTDLNLQGQFRLLHALGVFGCATHIATAKRRFTRDCATDSC